MAALHYVKYDKVNWWFADAMSVREDQGQLTMWAPRGGTPVRAARLEAAAHATSKEKQLLISVIWQAKSIERVSM